MNLEAQQPYKKEAQPPTYEIPDEPNADPEKAIEEALASVEGLEELRTFLDNAVKIYISEFLPKDISKEEKAAKTASAREIISDRDFRNEVQKALKTPNTNRDVLANKYAMQIRDLVDASTTLH